MTVLLAFDLETVCDTDLGRRLYGLTGTDAEVAAAMLARRLEESHGKSDFLKPSFHRIVALGAAGVTVNGPGPTNANVAAWAGEDERELLERFIGLLQKRPRLVSWNGGGFDLPVIRYRALLHRLDAAALYGPSDQRQWERYDYRYGETHVDLMDALAGFGASTSCSLDEVARLVGLPGKSIATGDQVAGLVAAGAWQTVEAYVASDAVQTLALFLRWEYTRGRLGANQIAQAITALRPKVDPELGAAIEASFGAVALAAGVTA